MWRLIFAIFLIHDFGARFGIPRPVFFRLLPDVINPLQANLNFMRKRSVPKFIQNGGVRKSSDMTAATLCAFFKLECR